MDCSRPPIGPGKPLAIKDPFLAQLIALEWDQQLEHINRTSMHLSSLAFTAVDDASGQTPAERSDMIVSHVSTDTLLYRQEIPTELFAFQNKRWDPVLAWFESRYRTPITTSLELERVVQPAATTSAVKVDSPLVPHLTRV
jgi:chaperone required for assembly of F1-ATPase